MTILYGHKLQSAEGGHAMPRGIRYLAALRIGVNLTKNHDNDPGFLSRGSLLKAGFIL